MPSSSCLVSAFASQKFEALRDDAIAVWRDYLVAVHRPRRIQRTLSLRLSLARKSLRLLAAGYAHSLALRRNGSVAWWGDNAYGQAPAEATLGDALLNWTPFMTEVPDL